MKRKLLLLLLAFIPSLILFAQVPEVEFDPNTESIIGGKPFPANTRFLLTGKMRTNPKKVSAEIFKGGKMNKAKALYYATWSPEAASKTSKFRIPVGYYLVDGERYDLRVRYFGDADFGTKNAMMTGLTRETGGYYQTILVSCFGKDPDKALRKSKQRIRELNSLVRSNLAGKVPADNPEFPGFSNKVETKLWELNELVKIYQEHQRFGDLYKSLKDDVAGTIKKHIEDLKKLTDDELKGYLDKDMQVMLAEFELIEYPARANASFPISEVPKVDPPKVDPPKVDPPKVDPPKVKAPKEPKVKTPKEPKVKTPKTPKVKTPKTPKVKTPKTPKVKTPKTPKVKAPRTPKVKSPKTPKVKAPKTPKVKTPKTPKVKTPKEPKVKEPKGPEVKEPKATPEPEGEIITDKKDSGPKDKYWKGISLDIGYGVTYLNDFKADIQDASFGPAPFIGVSIPFGKPKFRRYTFGSAFSFSAGFMLTPIRNENEEDFTGPGLPVPIYTALGIHMFEVLRLHLGASYQTPPAAEGETSKTTVRPWVGLALDLNYRLFQVIANKKRYK